MKIPGHLQHLRRDRRGLPVPWVNRWGPETTDRITIAEDPHAHTGLSVFLDDSDQTEPDFTAQNPQRQRQAMAQGLCQVCRTPLSWSARELVLFSGSIRFLAVPGLGSHVPTVEEPWLCRRCADFATTTCPALIRAHRRETPGDTVGLLRLPIRRQSDVALVATTVHVDDLPDGGAVDGVPPVMWLRVALIAPGVRHLILDADGLVADQVPTDPQETHP